MTKLRENIILLIFMIIGIGVVILVVDGFQSYSAKSQETKPIASSREPEQPAIRGSAVGEVTPFEVIGDDLKTSVLTHPPPKVFLEFNLSDGSSYQTKATVETGHVTRIELSDQATSELNTLRKVLLAYFYEVKIEGRKSKSVTKRLSEDQDYSRSILWTEARLQEIELNAPDGQRKLCKDEAESAVKFIKRSAEELVDQAKTHVTQSQ